MEVRNTTVEVTKKEIVLNAEEIAIILALIGPTTGFGGPNDTKIYEFYLELSDIVDPNAEHISGWSLYDSELDFIWTNEDFDLKAAARFIDRQLLETNE